MRKEVLLLIAAVTLGGCKAKPNIVDTPTPIPSPLPTHAIEPVAAQLTFHREKIIEETPVATTTPTPKPPTPLPPTATLYPTPVWVNPPNYPRAATIPIQGAPRDEEGRMKEALSAIDNYLWWPQSTQDLRRLLNQSPRTDVKDDWNRWLDGKPNWGDFVRRAIDDLFLAGKHSGPSWAWEEPTAGRIRILFDLSAKPEPKRGLAPVVVHEAVHGLLNKLYIKACGRFGEHTADVIANDAAPSKPYVRSYGEIPDMNCGGYDPLTANPPIDIFTGKPAFELKLSF